jgi:hypothetical protein
LFAFTSPITPEIVLDIPETACETLFMIAKANNVKRIILIVTQDGRRIVEVVGTVPQAVILRRPK